MKLVKKIIALVLGVLMAFSFTGCIHKKGEIAVKINGVEFTSAYYACALINAKTEAQNKVYETLTDEEKSSGAIDFSKKKIDKKPFDEWVKDKAIENLKTIAAYKLLCKENKLELSEEEANNANIYASYYWSNYGYSAYFEPNGVSQATYADYMKDTYYSEKYFEFLYGTEGEKAIEAGTVKTKIYDNFIIANVLNAFYGSEDTDADKKLLKEKLEGYVTALKKGTKTFEAVYKEYNGNQEDASTESEQDGPKDKYATILGAEGTSYANDNYKTVKAMAVGEVKLIELEDKSGFVLAVKQDITADDYYLENLDMTARHLIADEEYKKTIDDYAKKLELKVSKYAINQFKVDKIVEPNYGY